MQITKIHINIMNDRDLLAFVNVIFDNCLAINGLKIVRGKTGTIIMMPSKVKTRKCPGDRCHRSNAIDAIYCNWCGKEFLDDVDAVFKDVAHPINNWFRCEIEGSVMRAYEEEVKRMSEPVSEIEKQT